MLPCSRGKKSEMTCPAPLTLWRGHKSGKTDLAQIRPHGGFAPIGHLYQGSLTRVPDLAMSTTQAAGLLVRLYREMPDLMFALRGTLPVILSICSFVPGPENKKAPELNQALRGF